MTKITEPRCDICGLLRCEDIAQSSQGSVVRRLEDKSERQATNIGALYRQRLAAEARVRELEQRIQATEYELLDNTTQRDSLRAENEKLRAAMGQLVDYTESMGWYVAWDPDGDLVREHILPLVQGTDKNH